MNKTTKTFFLTSLSLIIYLGLFGVVLAVGETGTDYVLLEPLPGISSVPVGGFGGYLAAMFKLSIGLATVLAVLQLSIAGFKYLTQDSFSQKSDARETINNALFGLLLLLSSYLILKTINPDLVTQDLMITPVGGNVSSQGDVRYDVVVEQQEGVGTFQESIGSSSYKKDDSCYSTTSGNPIPCPTSNTNIPLTPNH